ncbi:OTU protein [Xanthoria parietina]
MMEQLQSRHRQEQRELQARVTQKKKSATKKTRKGINDECCELTMQLKERQELELSTLEGTAEDDEHTDIPTTDPEPVLEEPHGNGAEDQTQKIPGPSVAITNEQTRKPNRQKARLARRAAEQDHMIAEAAKEAQDLPDLRRQEIDAMRTLFTSKGLQEHAIRSDGHCLYAAIADQLTTREPALMLEAPLKGRTGISMPLSPPYKVTRFVTASYIQDHADEFLPFLEEPLDDYVGKIRDTGEWGGHLELLALAKAYDVDINVLQSSGQVERIESGTDKTRMSLWLSYYHHNFGLGEHYNSLRHR